MLCILYNLKNARAADEARHKEKLSKLNTYTRKKEKIWKSINLSIDVKKLEKQQSKPKERKWRAERNETENTCNRTKLVLQKD